MTRPQVEAGQADSRAVSKPRCVGRRPRAVLLVWVAAYLAMIALLLYGLHRARGNILKELSGATARSAWRQWQSAARRQNEQERPVVVRRLARTDEPPLLVLMRDHFAAVAAVTLIVATVLFGFTMMVLRGTWRGSTIAVPAAGDSRSAEKSASP